MLKANADKLLARRDRLIKEMERAGYTTEWKTMSNRQLRAHYLDIVAGIQSHLNKKVITKDSH